MKKLGKARTQLQQSLAGWEQLQVGLAVCGSGGSGGEKMGNSFWSFAFDCFVFLYLSWSE